MSLEPKPIALFVRGLTFGATANGAVSEFLRLGMYGGDDLSEVAATVQTDGCLFGVCGMLIWLGSCVRNTLCVS